MEFSDEARHSTVTAEVDSKVGTFLHENSACFFEAAKAGDEDPKDENVRAMVKSRLPVSQCSFATLQLTKAFLILMT